MLLDIQSMTLMYLCQTKNVFIILFAEILMFFSSLCNMIITTSAVQDKNFYLSLITVFI